AAIMKYVDATNQAPAPFIWTKSADDILASLGRYCTRISDSGH
ncbi:MAG TPA: IS630 family transposase, partial [Longimicrobium sp.]|nr:IS630 family transposase [Longimicrobium sp.]